MAITKAPSYGGGLLGGVPLYSSTLKVPKQAAAPIDYSGRALIGGGTPQNTTQIPGLAGTTSPSGVFTPQISAPNTSYAAVNANGGGGLPTSGAPSIDPSSYLRELTSDPLYQTGLQSYNDQISANRNALATALRQAVIQGGWAPGTGAGQVNLSNVGGQNFADVIDQGTIDATNANQMSDRAQLQTQLNRGLADIPSQLAARGAARSGAANIASGNVQNQYDVAANQALQNLSQAIGGNVGQWAQNNSYALANWNAAQGNIADRLAQIAMANSQSAYNNDVPLGGQASASISQPGASPATIKLVNQIKSQLSAKAVAANPSGATVQKGRGVISIH